MTQAGTTCPTQAEDAIADAFARSAAWQALTETTQAEDPAEAAGVGNFIFFNSQPLPTDGHVFSLDELQERRVSMLVVMSAEDGFTVTPGDAQGVVYEAGQIDCVVERWIRDSEKDNPAIDENRRLTDWLVAAMIQATDYLLATKGQRWMQPMKMSPPITSHLKLDEIQGRWQQVTITIRWGQAGDAND